MTSLNKINRTFIAAIFNEWARQYAEDPESFSDVLDDEGEPVDDYGESCSQLFESIATDMQGGHLQRVEKVAGELYDEYCKDVGGKAFNGDDLPTWEVFRGQEQKVVQITAWRNIARRVLGFETSTHRR